MVNVNKPTMEGGQGDDVCRRLGGKQLSCQLCRSAENLRRCSRCRGVYYCSREHQLQDWKQHRRSCKKLPSPAPGQDDAVTGTSATGPCSAEVIESDTCDSAITSATTTSTSTSSSSTSTSSTSSTSTSICSSSALSRSTVSGSSTTSSASEGAKRVPFHCQPQSPYASQPSLPSEEKQHRNVRQSTPSRAVNERGNADASDINSETQKGTATSTSLATSTSTTTTTSTSTSTSSSTTTATTSTSSSTSSSSSSTSSSTTSSGDDSIQPKSLFDPRPYVPTEFPQPASRDKDVVARHAAQALRQRGYCVLDGFLAETTAGGCGRGVLAEARRIGASGLMADGPLSGGHTGSESAQKFTERAIRGDKIAWLHGNEAQYPAMCSVVSRMDDLVQRLSFYLQGMYTINGRTKAMVACYPGNGTGYACHVDNPNGDGRCITCIYYLNDNWDVKTQGGLLRLLPATGGHVDVQPILNRLLLFWSDRRNPHEVQPAYSTRYATTIWYFDKAEREKAKMVQLNEDMSKLRGEVALSEAVAQAGPREETERQIKKTSENAVASLSHQELQALSAMLEGQSDPRAVLSHLGVAQSIQDALLSQLKKTGTSGP